jgi:diacylglycerol kinase (ATP)
MKVTLIHNPTAGTDQQPSGRELVQMISSAGHSAVYQSANEENWQSALDGAGDIIAVAGGDGIVGRVAKLSIGSHAPIAVLPLGTANNVAKTLGLTDIPLKTLVQGWRSARRVKFDVGTATGPWGSACFIEAVGVGLFTEVMSRLDARGNSDIAHLPHAGQKILSVQEVLKARLHDYPPHKLKVMIDGHDLSGEFVLLEAMNIRSVGPNLCLAPNADPGDGLFDVAYLRQGEQNELIKYLAESVAGELCAPRLTVKRGKFLKIELQGVSVHIDDEAWPKGNAVPSPSPIEISVKLDPESLIFLAPELESG